ncbi:MAG: type II toxin-antitoxin system HicA family toxin [Chloroflexi bacterium]|nr:type II toxin-antitoxin system HicA family toxin [Chloroflexota bacterium]
MKVREITYVLDEDHWYLIARRGSHRQYKLSPDVGRITIAGHSGHELGAGTLGSVLKQAQAKGSK